jgi:hypothetical protein
MGSAIFGFLKMGKYLKPKDIPHQYVATSDATFFVHISPVSCPLLLSLLSFAAALQMAEEMMEME